MLSGSERGRSDLEGDAAPRPQTPVRLHCHFCLRRTIVVNLAEHDCQREGSDAVHRLVEKRNLEGELNATTRVGLPSPLLQKAGEQTTDR